MLPEDIQDVILATCLLVVIVITGTFFPNFGISTFTYHGAELTDEGDLFLLNYARTEIGDVKISDLIAFAENNPEKFFELQTSTRQIFGFYTAGRDEKDYVLRVKYPGQEYKIIDFKLRGEEAVFDKYKELKISEGVIGIDENKKHEIKLPSINKGLIEIEMELEDG